MFCPYCGSQNADTAKACAKWGRVFHSVNQFPVNAQSQGQTPGQDYDIPPPPPGYGPGPPGNAAGQSTSVPTQSDADLPPRKRTCPGCNEKIGLRYSRTSCHGCGTIYHQKCFSQGSITVSTKTAIMMFPAEKGAIIESIVNSKLAQMKSTDDAQRNDNRNKLLMVPEDVLIQGTNQAFCKLCVPKINAVVPKMAKDLEKAGRYEDAGRPFEEFGMIDAAGAVPKKGRAQVVTNISVDLNDLLGELKKGGLVSVYKCPNCGGSIKISGTTSTQKLSKCEYCGTILQTEDLVNFIRDILG